MKRQQLSAVGVAALVLLAGTAALAGATVTDGQQQTPDVSAFVAGQGDAGNATEQVNVTVETLELRNVTFTNVTADHVHVTGTVTDGDETVLETADEAETVENISAQQLLVTNGTLENVSFSNLTVRNESLTTALLGNQTTGDEELTVSNAVLENRTIDGVAIEHGNLGDATIDAVRSRSGDAAGTESDGMTQAEPAMKIYSLSVENASIGEVSATGLSIGNETASNEITAGGDRS